MAAKRSRTVDENYGGLVNIDDTLVEEFFDALKLTLLSVFDIFRIFRQLRPW